MNGQNFPPNMFEWELDDVVKSLRFAVSPRGVEPLTFASGGQRSIQLSYGDAL